MSFTSHLFLLAFLPLAVLLHWLAPARLRNGVLAAASLVFLAWAGPALLLPLLVVACRGLLRAAGLSPRGTARSGHPRAGRSPHPPPAAGVRRLPDGQPRSPGRLQAPAAGRSTGLAHLLGLSWVPTDGWQVAVPLGLSFYTFQSLSHTIDVFRGHTPACRRFVDYLAYLAAFPRLVAGPIVRFHQMADRLSARRFEMDGLRPRLPALLPRARQEGAARQPPRPGRRHRLRGRCPVGARCLVRPARVRLPDLPGLLGLHRHGPGARPDGGARAAAQLRRPVPVGLGHRVLAALAHHALVLAAGLRVPAGGLLERPAPGAVWASRPVARRCCPTPRPP